MVFPQCSLGRELSQPLEEAVCDLGGGTLRRRCGGPALRTRREPSAHVAVSVVACDQRRGARAWRGPACSDDAARRADIGWGRFCSTAHGGPPTSLMSRPPLLGALAYVGTSNHRLPLDVCGKTEAAGQRGVVEEGDLL